MENNVRNQNEAPLVKKTFLSRPKAPGKVSRNLNILSLVIIACYILLNEPMYASVPPFIFIIPLAFLQMVLSTTASLSNLKTIQTNDKIILVANIISFAVVITLSLTVWG